MARTNDKTADFLLNQIKFLRRVGDHEHKRDADRWERIIRQHAQAEAEPMAVNFATGAGAPQPAQG